MAITIKMLLEQKGRSVLSLNGKETLLEVCSILNTNKVGAAIVLNAKGGLLGIISERDIVNAIAKNGADSLNQLVEIVMTKNVVTCAEQETVVSLMKTMTEGRFRHVPVVEKELITGVISIGDIVKSRMDEMELEVSSMRDYISQ